MTQRSRLEAEERQKDRREAAPHLSQTHSAQFLAQQLRSLQGVAVVEHRDAHHGRLDVGTGHHQDLPQSANQRRSSERGRSQLCLSRMVKAHWPCLHEQPSPVPPSPWLMVPNLLCTWTRDTLSPS